VRTCSADRLPVALHIHMIGLWCWLTSLLGCASVCTSRADRFGSRVLKHETACASAQKRMQKTPPQRAQVGCSETGIPYAAYFITDPTDYPRKCRDFPGSLRCEVNVSARRGATHSGSQLNRDDEGRISDTRVLCVVVVTQRGITVFVAVETRARPVHSCARLTGVRWPAQISAR